jgi:RHS repeat-associated protein
MNCGLTVILPTSKCLTALDVYDTTIDYTYDDLSRLLEADYVGGSTYSYEYDLAGNLVDNNGVTNTFNDANQLTGDGTDTFDYDANGNLWKTNSVVSHTWDRANRLLSHGTHSYAYDGNSARIQKTVSSVVTDYLLDVQRGLTQVLRESDGTNINHYIHSPRGIHAMNDGSNWSYMLQDGLGSVRAEIAQNVAVNGSQSYAPYGEVFGASGIMNSPFAFTGEPLDGNGLQYHRARYYAPEMGVWANQDFLETPNRYGYVEGNPVMWTDPSGLDCGLGSYPELLKRNDKLLSLAQKWNRISEADCVGIIGTNPVDECGNCEITNESRCSTGLSNEAFAYLMASILHVEGLLKKDLGEWFGHSLNARLGNLAAGTTGMLGIDHESAYNSSEGLAKIRPSTLDDIFRGIIPAPNDVVLTFDTTRLQSLQNDYSELLQQKADWLPPPFTTIDTLLPASIFDVQVKFLKIDDVSMELLAINMYRGILRIKSGEVQDVSEPTIFNLGAWHNAGIQGGQSNPYDAKAANYGYGITEVMAAFVEGDCDLGFGRQPNPWEDFMYYNDIDAEHMGNLNWGGSRPND